MSIVALIGDCTTTSALALSSAWPTAGDIVIVEADPTGGSLSAWLGTPPAPSLSAIAASARSIVEVPAGAWSSIEPMIHRSASGTRFIPAPVRSREAFRAIREAGSIVFPVLARHEGPAVLADLGRVAAADGIPVFAGLARVIVLCHRQTAPSSAASSVRLERLAETVELLAPLGVPMVVAIIGEGPFDRIEIARFLSAEADDPVAVRALPEDALTAAVFAGRTGVSVRRLARLPLIRAARAIARELLDTIDAHDAVAPCDAGASSGVVEGAAAS